MNSVGKETLEIQTNSFYQHCNLKWADAIGATLNSSHSQCGNFGNLLSSFFRKNSMKSSDLGNLY